MTMSGAKVSPHNKKKAMQKQKKRKKRKGLRILIIKVKEKILKCGRGSF